MEISHGPERNNLNPKGLLEHLKESVVFKKTTQFLKEIFTQDGLEKHAQNLWGALLGFFNSSSKPETPTVTAQADQPRPVETSHRNNVPPETQAQLNTLSKSITQPLLDHTSLESWPWEVNKKTGVTLCSGTALKNLRQVGCTHIFRAKDALRELDRNPDATFTGIPQGNAIDVMNFYRKSRHHPKIAGTPSNKDLPDKLDSSGKKIADILVDSSSPYEHRAVAFKSLKDGHWYILDPYRSGRSQKPIPFALYRGKVEFAVPLQADTAPSVPYAPALS